MAIFQSKSILIGLLSRGMLNDLLTPWRITVNTEKQQILIQKRNWYLFGIDENLYSFNSIREIDINKFLFGADLEIIMYRSTATVISISKSDALKIRNLLLP